MRSYYARVEHKVVVGVDIVNFLAYQHVVLWFGGIVGRDDPDQPYAYAYARPVPSTCFAHRWLAGDISPTLVEPSVATPGP